MDVIIDRVAGLDVHQKSVTVAVRTPGTGRSRAQEVRTFRTYTGDLVALREWLVASGVSLVVMEASGVYWKPVWYVLEEDPGLQLELVNPQHVKNLPVRKTDTADAAWLAQLAECGLPRGSFIPPKAISQLRDLTRYRTKIVRERVREVQRLQKLLEDANVKLASLVTDITGVSGRQMIEALIAGERDPDKLADLARTRMRPKIAELRLALVGRFEEQRRGMSTWTCGLSPSSVGPPSPTSDSSTTPFSATIRSSPGRMPWKRPGGFFSHSWKTHTP
jgi:transposase